MKRVVIIAKGRVQRVGYRDEVEEIARKLKITGFVENVKPYDVRIVAERSVELGGESVEIGKKMLGKQDMMLQKQDETIDVIEGVSEKIDRSKEEIVTEISSLRYEMT